jgi:hypothetical protein
MTTSKAANRNRHPGYSRLKSFRQHRTFAGSRVKNWTDGAAEAGVLSPKLQFQTASPPVKQDGTDQPGLLAVYRFRQRMPRNQQIVGPFNSQHLEPD